ncbi:GreA/GreB family elongation factor [Marinomonas sp. THO17]|uniref:GreA/GreB family elongation factor n=1 Tax=Marinomonas sp. THO17 TaxID=3149048 RepID=UPI00336C1A45
MIDKSFVFNEVLAALELRFVTAKKAAQQAKEAATNEESVAETKYDTFGLEASYLAHGQSERVYQCEQDWLNFKRIMTTNMLLDPQDDVISLWSTVHLQASENGAGEKYFLLSNIAGGLNLPLIDKGKELGLLVLISPSAPIGQMLMNKSKGETVFIPKAGQQIEFEIVGIN